MRSTRCEGGAKRYEPRCEGRCEADGPGTFHGVESDREPSLSSAMSVYFLGPCKNGNPIKIGVAKDIHRRRRTLQTGNPAPLEVMGWITSDDDYGLEASVHKIFETRRVSGEWFDIQPADILSVLRDAGINGFVAKNADAFQIIGRDNDAVPEYLGVWNWGDLEFEECCPFCGCLCGMHFQDASSMYYCISCDTLTDFSELSPHHDD